MGIIIYQDRIHGNLSPSLSIASSKLGSILLNSLPTIDVEVHQIIVDDTALRGEIQDLITDTIVEMVRAYLFMCMMDLLCWNHL